ncbi:MAG: spermidine synthase [Alphaproteobacteria bacterium]|nr:spermidine synthase [Alphaproteobacteria bacterium]
MSALFKELAYRETPIGALSLRRRRELSLDVDVYEIKLGDEFLMSSLFTASEIALADLGVAALGALEPGEAGFDIVVGGLGLGYTAQAVLAHQAVGSLVVVDYLQPIIDWHRTGLLPLGPELTADSRCRFVQGDFFAMAEGKSGAEIGFDPDRPGRRFDAILVDIDHAPDALLDDRSASFYRPAGLAALMNHLKPGGAFGLWSNDRPDTAFTERLAGVFAEAWDEPVTFPNPLQDRPFTQTVYLARAPR